MSPFGEQGSQEARAPFGTRRSKSGLETPLRGRFYGEGKRLIFAPPLWYDALVVICIAGGAALFLVGMLGGIGFESLVALMVCFAGIWGALSNERMVCDLRTGRYSRLEGQGLSKHIVRGSLDELDALVLTAELYPHGIGIGVHMIYRQVLYWKGQRQPLLVVERIDRTLPSSAPVSQAAPDVLQQGVRYAQALRVKYYDNSQTLSRSPVPYM